ncbi:MAG: M23 family metallopeptidase [Gammaproteobacteria bacterium]|nr:M23 family metallopeptidase [Gammaproteobacteria bacterium]
MKILLLSNRHHKSGAVSISPWWLFVVLVLAITGASTTSSWVGYNLGHELGTKQGTEQEQQRTHAAIVSGASLQSSIEQQRKEWEENRLRANSHLNVLALKLGQMQSHVVRLNALGERLAKMGELDSEEFNFKKIPGRGGVDSRDISSPVDMPELVSEIDSLSRVIEDREVKLNILEELIMNYDLQKEIHPSGQPVKGGYISSKYGERRDPFTGKKTFHHGVDIASRPGTAINAVGSGIVIFSGTKSGYGKLVKVQHGNGFVTIYGHNQELKVNVGDYVSKGQNIATVGSTGRSTGPHVHFEVQLDGEAVNPVKYLRAAK